MKKILLGIAVFFTTAILCIVSAGAETYGDYTYTVLGDGTVEITDYNGSDSELVIPSELDGKKVTSIGEAAFESASLETVSIPDSVKTIGDYAFNECGALALINIPQGVTSIGDYAFWYCQSLVSIEFPASVTSIGEDVFAECYGLKEILVDSANKNYASADGVLFNKNMTELIMYPSAKEGTSYIVPSTVTKLGGYAFADCVSLTSITLPEGLTEIGHYAFPWCENLKTITIPEKVTTIGDYAFWYDWSLTDINVDADNKNYASVDGVLYSKDMTEIVAYPSGKTASSYDIPDGVKTIDSCAFTAATIETITIPVGVTNIGDFAFSDCTSLKAITIPDGVTSIGEYAFAWCYELKSADIADSVKSIGEYCFDCCYALETANVPKGITVIEDFTFGNCKSLKSIIIPDGVTSIGEYSFNTCRALTSIVIPDSVTSIGRYAFLDCECLESITIPESVTEIDKTAFIRCENVVINCYEDSVAHQFAIDNSLSYVLIVDTTPVSAVSGFRSPSKSATAIRLSWTKSDKVSGYVIEQYTTSGWVQIADITDSSTTTYKVTELDPGTAYKFRMKAYKNGTSKATYGPKTETLTVNTLMTAVKGFASPSKSTTAIRLSWTLNAYADGYLIEQYTNDGWVQIADITDGATTTYKVTGLKSGTAYKFRMKAYSVTKYGETILGDKTATLTANTQASSVKDFALKSRSDTALRLKWAKNTAVDGYAIEQMIDGEWTEIADIDSYKTTEYKVTGLAATTSYEFRMRAYAVTKYGEKTYSAYTSVLTKTTSPSAVSGFKVKSKSDKAIRLAWTPSEAIDGYSIEMYIDGEWTFYTEASVTATELKVTGLESATEYQFRIRAYVIADDTVLYSGYKTVSGMTL